MTDLLFQIIVSGMIFLSSCTGQDTVNLSVLLIEKHDAINCPEGYVGVPKNPTVGTIKDFCIARYEMSQTAGEKPESRPDLFPITWVSFDEAKNACESLGAGYHLMTNEERMTIARNIELVAENWVGAQGSTTGTAIKQGNNGGICAGGITEACYDGMDPECGTGRDQRAMHRLSNGGEIWDFSGNIWEWVDRVVVYDRAGPVGDFWIEINAAIPTTEMPSESFKSLDENLNRSHGIGMYFPGNPSDADGSERGGGVFQHGGGGFDNEMAGVYALSLKSAEVISPGDLIGFRCSYTPDK